MDKPFFILFLIFLTSCSLNYEKEENQENLTPELILKSVKFKKIENNRLKVKMNADIIEQYKSDSFSFASNVDFTIFNTNEQKELFGKCNFISADTINEKYILLGNINLSVVEQNIDIFAETLNIDKKNEQITSGINNKVQIKKDNMDIVGVGFSASNISNSFSFSDKATGNIITEENK